LVRTALLPALLVLALVVRLIGLEHEVEGRYYLDEGTYYHHAIQILEGELFSSTFVYPHLLYYLDAFTLWLASLFPGAVARLVSALFGVEEPLAISWLLLRGVVAVLSALTTVPVFFLGRRLGGTTAGVLGALLVIFSPLFNEGSHLNTCDVPSAFFATVCLAFAARLIDEERWQDYVWAGLAAGLAAGSKYPAGVVAVAIVAVWIRWRIARRDFSLGLLLAGLAALAAFVATTPSLLVFPKLALFGGRGILFGARQYGAGGWIGVMPQSNALYYGRALGESFGWLAVLLGLGGLFLLQPPQRKRLIWLLPFPVLYLALIVSMNMVVRRNLYPAIPILAVFLGAGSAAWIIRIRAWLPQPFLRATAAAILILLAVGPAVARTTEQGLSLSRPSTREEAREWIRENLPHGVTIVKESYTPRFRPEEFAVLQSRFAGRFSVAQIRDPRNDYLLLASAAYNRFQNPAAVTKEHQRAIATQYQEFFRGFPQVRQWSPGRWQLGPTLKLYRIDPEAAVCTAGGTLVSEHAFIPDGGMRRGPKMPVRYFAPGQWSLFKGCFEPGSYRVELDGTIVAPGEVLVRSVDGREIGRAALETGRKAAGPFSLASREKVLFTLSLAPGSRVRRVRVVRAGTNTDEHGPARTATTETG
jgi:4-amino-4-deoxy-L-arabinose transferase-like glycosyltransferase